MCTDSTKDFFRCSFRIFFRNFCCSKSFFRIIEISSGISASNFSNSSFMEFLQNLFQKFLEKTTFGETLGISSHGFTKLCEKFLQWVLQKILHFFIEVALLVPSPGMSQEIPELIAQKKSREDCLMESLKKTSGDTYGNS